MEGASWDMLETSRNMLEMLTDVPETSRDMPGTVSRDVPGPRLPKGDLAGTCWRQSTFFNTGEKFRKIFRSLYVHRLGKNNEAVNEAVSVPRVSLAKPLISGAKP